MTASQMIPYIAAVIIANGISALFFIAAVASVKAQKLGAKDSELPLWVYAGLIFAPLMVAIGAYLLKTGR